MQSFKFYVTCPEERPIYWSIPAFLWGDDCDFDSDGNADSEDDRAWTELYVRLRGASQNAVVNIFPHQDEPLILAVTSPNSSLAVRAAYVLARHTKGKIAKPPSENFEEIGAYAGQLGNYFDLEEALQRFDKAAYPQ